MPTEVNSFINLAILQAAPTVIGLLVLLATGALKWGVAFLKSKTSEKDQQTLAFYADWAVKAAQQSGLANLIKNTAEEKKNFAVEFLLAQAARIGLKDIPVDEIGAMIEKAYFENFGAHSFFTSEVLPPAILPMSVDETPAVG